MPDFDLLVDERCGIVTSVTPEPAVHPLPAAFRRVSAMVANARAFAPWQNDLIAGGTAFGDVERARRAAIGEAVERYCGNRVPGGLVRASWRELDTRAIDPDNLALYTPRQYSRPGFPFSPFTRDAAVEWCEGVDLIDRSSTLVPAPLTYLNYYGARPDEVPVSFLVYAGIAAGEGRADAERRAIEELIERDAVMMWWLAGAAAVGIDPRSVPVVAATAAETRLELDVVSIPNVFGMPVIGVLATDPESGIRAAGTAARADPHAAAEKALGEALQLHLLCVELDRPDGGVYRDIVAGRLDPGVCRPYRADRRYLDDVREDFSDVTDLVGQMQLHLDPRLGAADRFHTNGDLLALSAVPRADPRSYLERLEAEGIRPVSVDLTTPDVAESGLRVVRVVAPGLLPNGPAAFPFLGGRRLRETPVRLGWRETPLTEDEVFRAPLPYA